MFQTDDGEVLTQVSSSNLHQLEQVVDKAVELGLPVTLKDCYRHTVLFDIDWWRNEVIGE